MIDCTRDDGLWTLTLNRPEKANSLTAKMLEQLVSEPFMAGRLRQ